MNKKLEKATFAAGCFWHVEEFFRHLPGVVDVMSGYSGGTVADPTYEMVCSGSTGHAESTEVTFDPEKISYEELVRKFFEHHNPTTVNRQGLDIGAQYRSMIFYHSPEQEKIARGLKDELDKSGKYENPIVTEITKAKPFYKAEEYHQRYYEKHGYSK